MLRLFSIPAPLSVIPAIWISTIWIPAIWIPAIWISTIPFAVTAIFIPIYCAAYPYHRQRQVSLPLLHIIPAESYLQFQAWIRYLPADYPDTAEHLPLWLSQ